MLIHTCAAAPIPINLIQFQICVFLTKMALKNCVFSVLLFIGFVEVILAQCPAGVGVCDKMYRNDCGVDACIQRTRQLSTDQSRFWFGTDYDFACNNKAEASDRINHPECYEPELALDNGREGRKRSIAQRLFGNDAPFDSTRLEKFIDIKFISEAGNYSACGAYFDRKYRAFDVQPEMDPVEAWYVRSAPQQLYITPGDPPNTYYTVIFIDAGYGTLHGVFADLNETRILLPWRPPLAVANRTNPIVALAYRQPSRGYFIEPRWLMMMKSARLSQQMFDLNDFVSDHNLIGPVAINWIPITADAYSADALRSQGLGDTCLAYTIKQQILNSQSRASGSATNSHRSDFLPRDSLNQINTYLNVRFVATSASFSVCCQNYRFGQTTFNVNPLSDESVDAIQVRAKPVLISVRQGGTSGSGTSGSRTRAQTGSLSPLTEGATSFNNKFYTLIAVNPDVVNNAVATPFNPMAAYLLVNAPGTSADEVNFESAQEILPWERPVPAPKSPGERVWFLLYEQTQGELRNFSRKANMTGYADYQCGYELADRCLFRLNDFVQDFGLTLRGVTWFDVVSDAFARYVLVKSGQAEWNVCAYIPGYSRPCPNQIQLNKQVRQKEEVVKADENINTISREKIRGQDVPDRIVAENQVREPRRDGATAVTVSVMVLSFMAAVGILASVWI